MNCAYIAELVSFAYKFSPCKRKDILIWCLYIFRMTLLLGPPASGKTTLLQALSGKLDDDLRVCDPLLLSTSCVNPIHSYTQLILEVILICGGDEQVTGKVTYCGHEFNEFVPQRTCAYISQHDLHYGEMTVRETLDFSARSLGVGTRYEMLLELARREKEAGIKPDPEIDAFMKATAMVGQETSLITDYNLKVLLLSELVSYVFILPPVI